MSKAAPANKRARPASCCLQPQTPEPGLKGQGRTTKPESFSSWVVSPQVSLSRFAAPALHRPPHKFPHPGIAKRLRLLLRLCRPVRLVGPRVADALRQVRISQREFFHQLLPAYRQGLRHRPRGVLAERGFHIAEQLLPLPRYAFLQFRSPLLPARGHLLFCGVA